MKTGPKKSWVRKIWWKYTNNKKYAEYKNALYYASDTAKISEYANINKNLAVRQIIGNAGQLKAINFLHSGNAGDIIYSLPVVKYLAAATRLPVNFFLKVDQPAHHAPGFIHPVGNVMLNYEMADKLIPLLEHQPYISSSCIFEDQQIDVDLTLFRQSGIDLSKGNIARWNFYTTGINASLSESWLDIPPAPGLSKFIALSRSQRYQNHLIDYSFLTGYKDVLFLGLRSEFDLMRKIIRTLEWYPVRNFFEMAQVISGSKLFIGNQSLPFAIAEGLKTRRILEIYPRMPNVIPEGPQGFDFYFQNHFEYLVEKLAGATAQPEGSFV